MQYLDSEHESPKCARPLSKSVRGITKKEEMCHDWDGKPSMHIAGTPDDF
jgi:hypothetical protein